VETKPTASFPFTAVQRSKIEEWERLADPVWETLSEVAQGAEDAGRDVAAACRAHLATARALAAQMAQRPEGSSSTGRSGSSELTRGVRGDRPERQHADALRKRLERIAATGTDARDWRVKLGLPADGLAPANAEPFYTSPLLALADLDTLAREGIPVLGHTATTVRERDGLVTLRVTVGRRVRTLKLAAAPTLPPDVLRFPGSDRRKHPVLLAPGSVLARTRDCADICAQDAPLDIVTMLLGGITAAQARVGLFVTGTLPPLPVVTARPDGRGSAPLVVMVALANIASPATVGDSYANAQRRALGHRGRVFKEDTLRIVEHVERFANGPARNLSDEQWREIHASLSPAERNRLRFPRDVRRAYERASAALCSAPESPTIIVRGV
jgi:hypothetical protein